MIFPVCVYLQLTWIEHSVTTQIDSDRTGHNKKMPIGAVMQR